MLILVLGGASSGKSAAAERLVAVLSPSVTYVATLVPDPEDRDLQQRIDAHQHRRPSRWTTVNAAADLAEQLCGIPGTVLIDGLGAWVARHEPDDARLGALAAAMRGRRHHTVVVSDEVGLSVHPATEDGRRFQNAIGRANQLIADVADQTVVVIAGRVLTTTPLDIAQITGGAV